MKPAEKHRIKRQSLPEALAESLRERILNGEFQPGEALIQETLAEEYECSRMPIREAFRQLEATGLIVSKLHKGSVVAALEPDQARELFDLRVLLECDMLKHAIPNMMDEDIAAAQSVLRELSQAYKVRDMAHWGALNWEFHRTLYAPGNREQSMLIVQSINFQVERFIRLQLLVERSFEKAEREHTELLRLCAERDVPGATSLLRQHILDAGGSLIAALPGKGKQ